MTQKIKLIESEKLIEILKRYYPFYGDTELYATQDVIDECEKRAFEIFNKFLEKLDEKNFDHHFSIKAVDLFQQFLKEQKNQEAINLLNEWKDRDGSEINKTYEDLKKEQDGGE